MIRLLPRPEGASERGLWVKAAVGARQSTDALIREVFKFKDRVAAKAASPKAGAA